MSFCGWLLIASYLSSQTGDFVIHLILHAVGHERYEVIRTANDVTLKTTLEYTDRANVRTTSATLQMQSDYTPLELAIAGKPDSAKVEGASATVGQNGMTRTFAPPERYFAAFALSPFAIQSMMFRYWRSHGKPADLPILSTSATAEPVQITGVGHDQVSVSGKHGRLERYTVANLAFGREILWTDAEGDVVAIVTFAGGLPMEAVRSDYEPAFAQLYRGAVTQEMEDLKSLAREVRLRGPVSLRSPAPRSCMRRALLRYPIQQCWYETAKLLRLERLLRFLFPRARRSLRPTVKRCYLAFGRCIFMLPEWSSVRPYWRPASRARVIVAVSLTS